MGRPLPRGSTERLTPTGRRGRLDRVQQAMARDRVFEGGAELRALFERASRIVHAGLHPSIPAAFRGFRFHSGPHRDRSRSRRWPPKWLPKLRAMRLLAVRPEIYLARPRCPERTRARHEPRSV